MTKVAFVPARGTDGTGTGLLKEIAVLFFKNSLQISGRTQTKLGIPLKFRNHRNFGCFGIRYSREISVSLGCFG